MVMAHHNSTPESVLKAPMRTFGFVVEHTGMNRADRRHTRLVNSLGLGKNLFVPKSRQAPALNTPYRRPVKQA
jgi:hypothetical protein